MRTRTTAGRFTTTRNAARGTRTTTGRFITSKNTARGRRTTVGRWTTSSNRNAIRTPINGRFNGRSMTGINTISRSPFYRLFLNEVKDLHSTETQILRELPKLAKAASSPILKTTLRNKIHETQAQVKRLEQILRFLGEKARPQSQFSQGVNGIFREGQAFLARQPLSLAKDVAIIAAAQKIEHYEIAAYGAAKAHARRLALPLVANLLNKTFSEESATDRKFTKVADGSSFWTGLNKSGTFGNRNRSLAYSR